MKVLCAYPGKNGRKIAEILEVPIKDNWSIVGNPLGEETRRMYVVSSFRNKMTPADVPISKIRVLTEDEAYAIRLCHDYPTQEALIAEMLKDTV